MVLILLALVGRLTAVPADTVLVLGSTMMDLTGDGQVELLQVVAAGPSVDSLNLTFTIQSEDQVLYEAALVPLTRSVGFDAGRRRTSDAEHQERLATFSQRFFAVEKFRPAVEFEARLQRASPRNVPLIPKVIERDAGDRVPIETGARTWASMREDDVIEFEYSPGGDRIEAIAWSVADRRFYRLLECC